MSDKSKKPVRAYVVLENDERSGAIYFARHAITARKAGANEYGDGELSYVTCNRAPYADQFAETGMVPASVLVENGWHFECGSCGHRIDDDLPNAWELEVDANATPREMVKARVRYKRWDPDHVVGYQHTSVFCDAQCEADYEEDRRQRKAAELRTLERCKRAVLHRLPDTEFVDQHRVYVVRNKRGQYRPSQVRIAFAFPGMDIAPANWEFDTSQRWRTCDNHKAHFTCCAGDREAFEAWAREQKLENKGVAA